MNENIMLLFSLIVIFIIIFVITAISAKFSNEQERRIVAEKELKSTRESFKNVLENILKEDPNNKPAKEAYIVYFTPPVDHTGDGFIDGYE